MIIRVSGKVQKYLIACWKLKRSLRKKKHTFSDKSQRQLISWIPDQSFASHYKITAYFLNNLRSRISVEYLKLIIFNHRIFRTLKRAVGRDSIIKMSKMRRIIHSKLIKKVTTNRSAMECGAECISLTDIDGRRTGQRCCPQGHWSFVLQSRWVNTKI